MTKSRVDDALSSLAPLLRVRPELQGICRFGDDWESWHDAAQPGWAYFHIVVQGECLIDRPGHATIAPESRRHIAAAPRQCTPHARAHRRRPRQPAYRYRVSQRCSQKDQHGCRGYH